MPIIVTDPSGNRDRVSPSPSRVGRSALFPPDIGSFVSRRQAEAALAELQYVSHRVTTVPFPNCRWVLWPIVQLMATGLMANAILDAHSTWVGEGLDHMTVAT